jgi:CheY-like chemotaxis protein
MTAEPRAKILLVEDEILVGMMLRKRVEARGYKVVEIASTGEEAIRLARKHKPDLLFMDVGLPGRMDGVEAARQILDSFDIPVIFFTGNHSDKQLLERTEALEPVAILDKMGSFDEVLRAVGRALAR